MALRSSDATARRIAENAVNQLGARGYRDFRNCSRSEIGLLRYLIPTKLGMAEANARAFQCWCRLLSHAGQHVAVGVHRMRDGGVPQPLLRDLRVDPCDNMSVAQVCLRSWNRMLGNPALTKSGLKRRLSMLVASRRTDLCGEYEAPILVQGTRSRPWPPGSPRRGSACGGSPCSDPPTRSPLGTSTTRVRPQRFPQHLPVAGCSRLKPTGHSGILLTKAVERKEVNTYQRIRALRTASTFSASSVSKPIEWMGFSLTSGGYARRADRTRGTFTKPTKTLHLERAAGDQNPRKPEQGFPCAGSSEAARHRRHDLLLSDSQ
jgi:hypothetical protein